MKWYHTFYLFCLGVSLFCHQLATSQRLQELRSLAYSTQLALIEVRNAAFAQTEITEITTPDGRYSIKVERPKDGLLEFYFHDEEEKPGAAEPKPAPGGIRWPAEGRKIFNTDLVL